MSNDNQDHNKPRFEVRESQQLTALGSGVSSDPRDQHGREIRAVRKVVEHRLLTADSEQHLTELVLGLVNIGWSEYGGPLVLCPSPDNGLLRQVWTQQMVIYSAEVHR